MTMITPSYLGETIEYSSLHACRSTLEDPTSEMNPIVRWAIFALAGVAVTSARTARAHHEALFGPQSSLAVESDGFVSLQTHEHVYGVGSTYDQEMVYILSAGWTPLRTVPWALTLVQPFTYENARTPQGDQTGPLSSCGGCLARENLLLSTSYRFDFTGLQRMTGKDGNFTLLSAAIEPPTGDKDYAPFHGPTNAIIAAMAGLEWGPWSTVAIGYYRLNTTDNAGSKKGNNWLAGLGLAYTPVDERARMISFQMGVAAEGHDPDVINGAELVSGGWEILASPTLVWMPAARTRFFMYASLPIAQDYRADYQVDHWRAGIGLIYSFDRGGRPAVTVPSSRRD